MNALFLYGIIGVVGFEAGTHLRLSGWAVVLIMAIYSLTNLATYRSWRTNDTTISDPLAVMSITGWPALACLGILLVSCSTFDVSIWRWGYPLWMFLAFVGNGLGGTTHSDTMPAQVGWAFFPLAMLGRIYAIRH